MPSKKINRRNKKNNLTKRNRKFKVSKRNMKNKKNKRTRKRKMSGGAKGDLALKYLKTKIRELSRKKLGYNEIFKGLNEFNEFNTIKKKFKCTRRCSQEKRNYLDKQLNKLIIKSMEPPSEESVEIPSEESVEIPSDWNKVREDDVKKLIKLAYKEVVNSNGDKSPGYHNNDINKFYEFNGPV